MTANLQERADEVRRRAIEAIRLQLGGRSSQEVHDLACVVVDLTDVVARLSQTVLDLTKVVERTCIDVHALGRQVDRLADGAGPGLP